MAKQEAKQPFKVYRNSTCSVCDCFLCEVKMKVDPRTNEDFIVCAVCYRKIFKEAGDEKNKK